MKRVFSNQLQQLASQQSCLGERNGTAKRLQLNRLRVRGSLIGPSTTLARWRTSRYANIVAGQAREVDMRKYAKILGAFSMSLASLLGAPHAQENAVTAIDILLEPRHDNG